MMASSTGTLPAGSSSLGENSPPKRKHRSQEFWYCLCKKYVGTHSHSMGQKAFLQSAHSGENVSGTDSECVSFSNYLKKFKSGKLKFSRNKRQRKFQFPEVEEEDDDDNPVPTQESDEEYCSVKSLCEAEHMLNQLKAYGASQRLSQDDCDLLDRFGQALRNKQLGA